MAGVLLETRSHRMAGDRLLLAGGLCSGHVALEEQSRREQEAGPERVPATGSKCQCLRSEGQRSGAAQQLRRARQAGKGDTDGR